MQPVLGQAPTAEQSISVVGKTALQWRIHDFPDGGEGRRGEGTGSTVINQEIGLFLMGWAKGGRRHLSDPKGRGRGQPNIRPYFEENCRKMKKIGTGEASKICLCKSTT